jgi:hypothetical protein
VWDIARVGRQLLTDIHAAADGRTALMEHNADGLTSWLKWLT